MEADPDKLHPSWIKQPTAACATSATNTADSDCVSEHNNTNRTPLSNRVKDVNIGSSYNTDCATDDRNTVADSLSNASGAVIPNDINISNVLHKVNPNENCNTCVNDSSNCDNNIQTNSNCVNNVAIAQQNLTHNNATNNTPDTLENTTSELVTNTTGAAAKASESL